MLLIYPDSINKNGRGKIVSLFKNVLMLVEAIDDSDFYTISKKFDTISLQNVEQILLFASNKLFSKGKLGEWFNKTGLKNKRRKADIDVVAPIKKSIETLKEKINYSLVSDILKRLKVITNNTCYRKELFYDLCHDNLTISMLSLLVQEQVLFCQFCIL